MPVVLVLLSLSIILYIVDYQRITTKSHRATILILRQVIRLDIFTAFILRLLLLSK